MIDPPDKYAADSRHVMTGKSLNRYGAAVMQRTPIAGPGLASKDTPDGRIIFVKNPAKTAIVPVGDEWVAWMCVEGDQARFRIVRDVVLLHGAGEYEIEAEMWQSCEPGLEVTSCLAAGGLAMVGAEVINDQAVRVTALAPPAGFSPPTHVRIVLEGIRRGHLARWPRFSRAQAAANNAFWAAAHDPSIWTATKALARQIWRNLQEYDRPTQV
jgi:hypothetical protein